jgi:hypothetical protein
VNSFIWGLSLGLLLMTPFMFAPNTVERIGILAAISTCAQNEGVKSISPNTYSRYTIVCRNTATFNKMSATYVGEEFDNISMTRKEE